MTFGGDMAKILKVPKIAGARREDRTDEAATRRPTERRLG
jgi:hypothetical protein